MLAPMNAAMAEEIINLIKEGFVVERDPYGVPWKPKKKPDGRKVLSGETGRLKTGWHPVRLDKGGFTVAPSVDYAAPHQAPRRGRSGLKRPRRRMVPSGDRGLPRRWRKAMQEVAVGSMAVYFGGHGAGRSLGPVSARIAALKRRMSVRALLRRAVTAMKNDDEKKK
jgi:hypothetical protein